MSDPKQVAMDLVVKLTNKINHEQGQYDSNASHLVKAVRSIMEQAMEIEKHLRAEPRLSSLSVAIGTMERHQDDVASITITLTAVPRTKLIELRFDGTQDFPLSIRGLDVEAAELATERFKRNFSPYGSYDIVRSGSYDVDFPETQESNDFAAELFVGHVSRFFMSDRVSPEG